MGALRLLLIFSLFFTTVAFAETVTVELTNPLYIGNRARKTQYIDLNKILAQQNVDLKGKSITKIEVWGYTAKGGATIFMSEKSRVLGATRFAKISSPYGDKNAQGSWGYSKIETEPVPWPFVRVWLVGEVWLYKLQFTTKPLESPAAR